MQEYKIKITKYAFSSMEEISDYITYDLKSPKAAVNTLKTIWNEIKKLSTMPYRIPLVDEEPWHSQGIHRMLVKNYFVYFWIDEVNRKVQVTDVIYAYRDQDNSLQGMPLA